MTDLVVRGLPEALIDRLEERAERNRRTPGEEAAFILGDRLESDAREERVRQAQDWSRLPGLWHSDLPVEEEIAAIYAARTLGRKIDL